MNDQFKPTAPDQTLADMYAAWLAAREKVEFATIDEVEAIYDDLLPEVLRTRGIDADAVYLYERDVRMYRCEGALAFRLTEPRPGLPEKIVVHVDGRVADDLIVDFEAAQTLAARCGAPVDEIVKLVRNGFLVPPTADKSGRPVKPDIAVR